MDLALELKMNEFESNSNFQRLARNSRNFRGLHVGFCGPDRRRSVWRVLARGAAYLGRYNRDPDNLQLRKTKQMRIETR